MLKKRHLTLGEVFPHDAPGAGLLFRLCVIREDLRLEGHGLESTELAKLAGGDPWFPRLYFTRRIAQTIVELHRILFVVHDGQEVAVKALRDYVGRAPAAVRVRWINQLNRRLEKLRRAEDDIAYIRDELSAHFDRGRCGAILRDVGSLEGPVLMGEKMGDTYVGVAYHALGLVRHHARYQRHARRMARSVRRRWQEDRPPVPSGYGATRLPDAAPTRDGGRLSPW